jgi:hypothetical protein
MSSFEFENSKRPEDPVLDAMLDAMLGEWLGGEAHRGQFSSDLRRVFLLPSSMRKPYRMLNEKASQRSCQKACQKLCQRPDKTDRMERVQGLIGGLRRLQHRLQYRSVDCR